MANLKSISHRCHPILVAFVWELTKATIYLPLGCLQGGGWPCCVAFDAIERSVEEDPSSSLLSLQVLEGP